MIKLAKNFFDIHNLRPFESMWLLFVHVVALFGIIYALSDHLLFSKIALTHCIIHSLWGLGITAGAHRLWAHKSYKASFIWKAVIMILNSGINFVKFRCQSRINFPLEQRPSTSSQIFRYRSGPSHHKQGIFLLPCWMALGKKKSKTGRIRPKN